MGHGERKESRPTEAVLEVARAQHGAFQLAQALAAGLTRRQLYRWVELDGWTRLLPGVFVNALVPDTWRQRVSASCLWAGEGTAASHRTAAALWGMDGVRPGLIEVTIRRFRRSPHEWLILHETKRDFVLQRRDGIPITSITRTLIDLGSVSAVATVERALEDSLRRRLTTLARLRAALEQEGGRGRRGAAVLAELVSDRSSGDDVTESELERRVLRLLAAVGLPTPRCQHVVELPDGSKARLDFAYPAARIAIEADGFRWHSGREAWSRDRTRLNSLVATGWRVLHVTWTDLQAGGEELTAALRSMLGQQKLS